jgi:hypothetical protein
MLALFGALFLVGSKRCSIRLLMIIPDLGISRESSSSKLPACRATQSIDSSAKGGFRSASCFQIARSAGRSMRSSDGARIETGHGSPDVIPNCCPTLRWRTRNSNRRHSLPVLTQGSAHHGALRDPSTVYQQAKSAHTFLIFIMRHKSRHIRCGVLCAAFCAAPLCRMIFRLLSN